MSLRVLLVQMPLGWHDRLDTAPPLGLLTLGRIAKEFGAETAILDLNLECLLGNVPATRSFYQVALEKILAFAPDIVGFTSMGLDGHLGLELSRRLKDQCPNIWCILGGPHYSSVATPLLDCWSWNDAVICGAGEHGFRSILEVRKSGSAIFYPRIFKREATSESTPELRSCSDYSLVNVKDYFAVNPTRLALVEQGRGCVFDCSFCYSRSHWEKLVERNTEELIGELQELVCIGFKKVFFVQDNFLNAPKKAISLAQRIAAEKLPLSWQGYATVSQLSAPLIAALAESRCSDLFLGVDAVTDQSKAKFRKPLFKDATDLCSKILRCIEHGIQPTCAFLLEGPLGGNSLELENTLSVALKARLAGANIRLNLLSTYPGTDIGYGRTVRYSELKPRLLLDCPEIVWENKFAQTHPEYFPFHNTSLTVEDELSMVQFTHAAFTLINLFPWTLKRLITSIKTPLTKIITQVSQSCPRLDQVPVLARRELEIEQFMKHFVDNRPDDEFLATTMTTTLNPVINHGENR